MSLAVCRLWSRMGYSNEEPCPQFYWMSSVPTRQQVNANSRLRCSTGGAAEALCALLEVVRISAGIDVSDRDGTCRGVRRSSPASQGPTHRRELPTRPATIQQSTHCWKLGFLIDRKSVV